VRGCGVLRPLVEAHVRDSGTSASEAPDPPYGGLGPPPVALGLRVMEERAVRIGRPLSRGF
jgi:hypothetical protein